MRLLVLVEEFKLGNHEPPELFKLATHVSLVCCFGLLGHASPYYHERKVRSREGCRQKLQTTALAPETGRER